MPELPELRKMAKYISAKCEGKVFYRVAFSTVTKVPHFSVRFSSFRIVSRARGKEMRVSLINAENQFEVMHLNFNMGMTGEWIFCEQSKLPKHSHCIFHCDDKKTALAFVDQRRFGRWFVGDFDPERSPDPIDEFSAFCAKIKQHINDRIFNKPLCELLLDQEYFNGIGNYLRAEIILRAEVTPFMKARDALLKCSGVTDEAKAEEVNWEENKLLKLCRDVPKEVMELTGFWDHESNTAIDLAFEEWLKCYGKTSSARDSAGRTMWFVGTAGGTKKLTIMKKIRKNNEMKRSAKKKKKDQKMKKSRRAEDQSSSSEVDSDLVPRKRKVPKKKKEEKKAEEEDEEADFMPRKKKTKKEETLQTSTISRKPRKPLLMRMKAREKQKKTELRQKNRSAKQNRK